MDNIYSHDNGNEGGANNGSMDANQTETPPIMTSPTCGGIEFDYGIGGAVIFAVLCVFGLLYCFLGYRLFKATMFLTGFLFGSVLVYLICREEVTLPKNGLIAISILVGILCGLITMLVQYVGLFLTGFCFGSFLGIIAMIITNFFYLPNTLWIPLGVIFLTGLFFALAILYFQKGLTIFGTALLGAGCIGMTLDYYAGLLGVAYYILDVVSLRTPSALCWYHWAILASWGVLFLLGSLIQWRVTARHVDHRQAVHIKGRTKRNVDLQKLRDRERDSSARHHDVMVTSSSSQSRSSDVTPTTHHSRYRHLYQVRRSNGDVISQNYLRGIQNKLSTAVRKKVIAGPTPPLPRDRRDPDLDQSQTALTQTQLPDNTDL